MQEDKDAQIIMDLMKQAITAPIATAPPAVRKARKPKEKQALAEKHRGIVVLGSHNYVAGNDLTIQQAPTVTTPSAALLEHAAFQKAIGVNCSVAERSQLEWLVNERHFILNDIKAAMQRGGLRWSKEHGHLAPAAAAVSIALISFVFLVLLAFLTLFIVNWVPSHERIDPVKFYGVGTLFLCGFAGFYCAIWYWSVVPLKTAFQAARALVEKPAENR
jgi:hypothetical protein